VTDRQTNRQTTNGNIDRNRRNRLSTMSPKNASNRPTIQYNTTKYNYNHGKLKAKY